MNIPLRDPLVATVDFALFEAVPIDPACPHCAARGAAAPLPGVDAIYCISVRQQTVRAAMAMRYFHELGLCRTVIMHRPNQGKFVGLAIWRSHADIAKHALALGYRRVLILEDDVWFTAPPDQLRARVADAVARLPSDWWGLFLGHWPFQAYPVAPGLVRTRSGCTHAYIANEPLLGWLARTDPMNPAISVSWLGPAIDSAFANLPGMHAMDPIIAVQRKSGEMRADVDAERVSPFRMLSLSKLKQRTVVYSLMRHGAWLVKQFAFLHRPTLERLRLRPEPSMLEARLALESGLFDPDWYAAGNHDITDLANPLRHFLTYGGFEGRWPSPLFDTGFYLAKNPYLKKFRINPLVHYISRGAYEDCDPNPYFDSSWYLDANPHVARRGVNPLAHFAAIGWREGRDPSPRFNCARYLADNPAARAAGINPLVHFLESRQGAQPSDGSDHRAAALVG